MLDILIKNGLVVDGTGNPGFYAGVGVQGETVVILRGDYSHIEAARVIDATGKVVCPGFIDMHAHTGLVILAEPEHHPKVRQGITTELVGVDGNSYAPFTSHEDFLDFVELNSGLDGSPPLPGRWSTVAEYLSMFDDKVAVNIAYVIGNSPNSNLRHGVGRKTGHRRRSRQHEGHDARGAGGGRLWPVHRPRLSPWQLRRHR